MIAYTFGNKKVIKAESLEDAIGEFVLSCMDFSAFINTIDPYSKIYLEEPIGYTNGVKNSEYAQHRYFETIDVTYSFNGEEKKYILTKTEFENWHLRQKNILENKQKHKTSSNKNSSMVMLNNHVIEKHRQIRELKIKTFYETISLKKELSIKENEMQQKMQEMSIEMEKLEKQISILKTYSGIGRDVVKLRSGKSSDQKHIDIFQKFRYMKTEMEILTNMEFFDALSILEFDEFIANHYKEIMPSERSIQAFKVSKDVIRYDDIIKEMNMRELNNAVYLIIRDGDNLYRIFNNYELHEDRLFVSDKDTEYQNVLENIFSKNEWKMDNDSKHLKDSFDAYISKKVFNGFNEHRFSETIHACNIVYEYNQDILDKLKNEAELTIQSIVNKRREYIKKYNLFNELNEYSWRWGVSIGRIYLDAYSKYNEVRMMMEKFKAYKNNDHLTFAALQLKSINLIEYFDSRIKNELELLDDGISVISYDFYRGRNVDENDFSENIDPITLKPYFYKAVYYDFDKYIEAARSELRDKIEIEYLKYNYKNFHSLAILQNIFDSNFCFKDIEPIDFLSNQNIEHLHFIYDTSDNLIGNRNFEDEIKSFYSSINDLNNNEFFILLRKRIYTINYSSNYYHKIEEIFYEPVAMSCKISKNKNGYNISGLFDVYTKTYHDKGIYTGDRKILKIKNLDENDKIIKIDKKDKILKLLKNRTFRDDYEQEAKLLKKVYNVMKNAEKQEYNLK